MKNKNLLSHILVYSIGTFLSKGIGLLLLPLYTRVFSAEQYGVLDLLAVSIILLSYVVSFQMDQGVARYFVEAKSKRMKQSIVSTGLLHYLACFGVVTALIIMARSSIATLLLKNSDFASVVMVAGVFFGINSISLYVQNQLKWQFEAIKYTALSLLNLVLTPLLVLLFAIYFKLGLIGVYYAYISTATLIVVLGMVYIRHNINFQQVNLKVWKKMYHYSYPLIFSCIIAYLMQILDRYFISEMVSLSQLGVYGVGARIATISMILFQGFQVAFGPYLMNEYKHADTPVKLTKVFNILVLLSTGIWLFFGLFSKEFLTLMAGPEFYAASAVIPILLAAANIQQLGVQFSYGFSIAKKTKWIPLITLIGLLINIVLNMILIPSHGIVGASLATLISIVIVTVINISWSQRYYPIPYQVFKPALTVVVAIAIVWGLTYVGGNPIVKGIAMIAYTVCFAWVYRDELQIIMRKMKHLAR